MKHTSDDPEKCEVCGPLLQSLKITEVQVGFTEAKEGPSPESMHGAADGSGGSDFP